MHQANFSPFDMDELITFYIIFQSLDVFCSSTNQMEGKSVQNQQILAQFESLMSNDNINNLSRIMRKQTFFICENKDADQLCGHPEADQRLCFRYIDSSIPLLSKSEISSL